MGIAGLVLLIGVLYVFFQILGAFDSPEIKAERKRKAKSIGARRAAAEQHSYNREAPGFDAIDRIAHPDDYD
jgi:hypothetical protein